MKNLTLKIEQDQDATAPWEDDSAYKFFTNVPRHLGSMNTKKEMDAYTDGANNLDEVQDAIKADLKGKWETVLVYAYIHGGIALSLARSGQFADQWDSGLAGILALNMDEFSGEVDSIAGSIIETLNQYLSGDVHGYIIETEDGEEIESLWGMYGYDYCQKEGEERLKELQEQEAKESAWAANLG